VEEGFLEVAVVEEFGEVAEPNPAGSEKPSQLVKASLTASTAGQTISQPRIAAAGTSSGGGLPRERRRRCRGTPRARGPPEAEFA